jgi:hypothetical protein
MDQVALEHVGTVIPTGKTEVKGKIGDLRQERKNERKSFGGSIFRQQDLDENEMRHMQVDILRLKSISSSF